MKEINFIKLCSDLDKSGFYKSSDKLETLVKISQGIYGNVENPVPLPSEYRTTNLPYTGNPLIDSFFGNMSDSAMGREFAGGMFGMDSPYESDFGPDKPFLAPYQFSPTEQRDLEKFDPDILLDATKENAQQAANYAAQLPEAEKQIGFIADKRGFESALPTLGASLSQTLKSKPIESWPGTVNEFVYKTRQKMPQNLVEKFQQVVQKALSDVVRTSKLDPQFAERLKKSPQAQKLFRDYNVVT